MGDPAGIGPELCVRLLSRGATGDAVPIVFGDAEILERVAARIGVTTGWTVIDGPELSQASPPDRECVVHLSGLPIDGFEPGRIDAHTGRASFRYIEAAIDAALRGEVDAVATGPIHKEAIHLAGVQFPGHTEIFAAKTGAARACMCLTSEALTVSFVTTHVGYADVPGLLRTERIVDVIELTADAMARLRGRAPRLLVCGLNPHAGEGGLFGGGEEERIIAPAVEIARSRGLDVTGPVPPDTAFLADRRRTFDAVVCMYHDQGHIPLKTLAFDDGINVTLGLPIIRTSVDHGTALDIAWLGVANPHSLMLAVDVAARLASGSTGVGA